MFSKPRRSPLPLSLASVTAGWSANKSPTVTPMKRNVNTEGPPSLTMCGPLGSFGASPGGVPRRLVVYMVWSLQAPALHSRSLSPRCGRIGETSSGPRTHSPIKRNVNIEGAPLLRCGTPRRTEASSSSVRASAALRLLPAPSVSCSSARARGREAARTRRTRLAAAAREAFLAALRWRAHGLAGRAPSARARSCWP